MAIAGDEFGTLARIARRERYAGPARALPVLKPEIDRLRAALVEERSKRNEAERTIQRLEHEISGLLSALQEAQFNVVVANSNRRVAIREVKDAFLIALAAENYFVNGASFIDSYFTSPDRHARYAKPRQIAMWLCRVITKQSTTAVGKEFGKRDHSTVLHAEGQVKAGAVFTSPMLRRAADRVLVQFGAEKPS